jgi:large subunit ribosomal protein L9
MKREMSKFSCRIRSENFSRVDTALPASILGFPSAFYHAKFPSDNHYQMPLTEIILIENVPGLGAEADVVKVRRGYARNYLLPHGKAHEVTPASLRQIDSLKAKRAEREARELNDAEELARRIGKARITFTLETGETGKAFGSVTAQDIVNRLKNELGAEIDRL